jgi:predicted transcriptional regulator
MPTEKLLRDNSNYALISIHPEHVERILSGEKVLEFRRVWAKKPVDGIVIYCTSPISKIVAAARIKKTHFVSVKELCSLNKSLGGGLSKSNLNSYFDGLTHGYALQLDSVSIPKAPIKLSALAEVVKPPQSFMYCETDFMKCLSMQW